MYGRNARLTGVRDYVIWAALEVLSQADPSPSPVPAPATTPAAPSVEGAVMSTLIAAGPVGVFFLMVLFKFKMMTVSEHQAVIKEKDDRIAQLEEDKGELKQSLREANSVYISQVIPTLTRVLDAERELVDLRRQEQADARWRDQQRGAGGDGGGGRGV